MKYIFSGLLFFAIIIMAACSDKSARLEQALRLAGDNRGQLEKVIEHYSANKADSQKLYAAIFLIENMPGHYSVAGEAVENQKKEVDAKYKNAPAFIRQYAYGIPAREAGGWQKYEMKEDVKTLTADFMIGTIDEAFEMWETCPWLDGLSFADFCDFILPYRKFDEPLIAERTGRDSMWRELRDIVSHYRNYRPIIEDLKRLYRERDWDKVMKSFKGDCVEMTYMSAMHQKQFAIPVTCDMVPAWSSYHGMHRWTIALAPGDINETPKSLTVHVPNKVYRITYSHNPLPADNGKEFIPPFFRDPFYRDVTSKYTQIVDVTIDVKGKTTGRPQNIYLSVFTAGAWTPVAWTSANGRKTRFADMGVNSVYMPVYYDEYTQHTMGYPLLVDKGGAMTELIPDKDRTIEIALTRKFPMKMLGVIRSTENVENVRIEASNDKDFRNIEVVASLPQGTTNVVQGWNTMAVADSLPYRYWRISKGGGRFETGELQFLDGDGNVVQGQTIQADENNKTDKTVYTPKYDKAFDGDALTFVESRSWFGLDMGEPRDISQVRYIGATDKNYIEQGHTYELMMFDQGEWRSQGMKTADADTITFSGVPSDGFYWLRNLTEGREERPFTYFDGKLRWY